MDTSTDFLTGSGTDCLGGDEEGDRFALTFEKCLRDGIWKDMLGWLYYLTPRKEARDAVKYAHTAIEGWVKQAMELKRKSELSDEKAKDRGERYVFVNELARHEEVDAIRVRDETMNVLLAGRDTTASLLSNLWFVLAREPEIYKKLQAEVDELKGQQPSYEALRNMKYIKYAVQESKQSSTLNYTTTLTKSPSHPSPPPLPPSPNPSQTRPPRHRPPPRRRALRPATALRPQRRTHSLQLVLHDAARIRFRA
jgi:hypothetical protein